MSAMSSIASYNSILTQTGRDSLERISDKYKKAKEERSWLKRLTPLDPHSDAEHRLMDTVKQSLMRRLNRAFRMLLLEQLKDIERYNPSIKKFLDKAMKSVIKTKGKEGYLCDLVFEHMREGALNWSCFLEPAVLIGRSNIRISLRSIIIEKQETNSEFFTLRHRIPQGEAGDISQAYRNANLLRQAPVFLLSTFKEKASPFQLDFQVNTVRGVKECTSPIGVEKLNFYFNQKKFPFSQKEGYKGGASSQSSQEEQAEKEAAYVIKKAMKKAIDYLFVQPLFRSALKENEGDKAQTLLFVDEVQAYMLLRESTAFLSYCEKCFFLPTDVQKIISGYLEGTDYLGKPKSPKKE